MFLGLVRELLERSNVIDHAPIVEFLSQTAGTVSKVLASRRSFSGLGAKSRLQNDLITFLENKAYDVVSNLNLTRRGEGGGASDTRLPASVVSSSR